MSNDKMDAFGGKEKSRGFFSKIKKKFKIGSSSASYEVQTVQVLSARKAPDGAREPLRSAPRAGDSGTVDASTESPLSSSDLAKVKDSKSSLGDAEASKSIQARDKVTTDTQNRADETTSSPTGGGNSGQDLSLPRSVEKKDGEPEAVKESGDDHPDPVDTNEFSESLNPTGSEFAAVVAQDTYSHVETTETICHSKLPSNIHDNHTVSSSRKTSSDLVNETLKNVCTSSALPEVETSTEQAVIGEQVHRVCVDSVSAGRLHDGASTVASENTAHDDIDPSQQTHVNLVTKLVPPGVESLYDSVEFTRESVKFSEPTKIAEGEKQGHSEDISHQILVSKQCPPDVESIYDSVDMSQTKRRRSRVVSCENEPEVQNPDLAPVARVETDSSDVSTEHVNFVKAKSKWVAMEEERSQDDKRMTHSDDRTGHSKAFTSHRLETKGAEILDKVKLFEPVATGVSDRPTEQNNELTSEATKTQVLQVPDSQGGVKTAARQRRSRAEIFEVCTPNLTPRHSGSSVDESTSQNAIEKDKSSDVVMSDCRPKQRKRLHDYEDVDLDKLNITEESSRVGGTNESMHQSEVMSHLDDFDGGYESLDLTAKTDAGQTEASRAQRRRRQKRVPSYEECNPIDTPSVGDAQDDVHSNDGDSSAHDIATSSNNFPVQAQNRRRAKRVPSYEDCNPLGCGDAETEEIETQINDETGENEDNAIYAVSKKEKKSQHSCKPHTDFFRSCDDNDDSDDDGGSGDTPPVPSRNYERTPSLVQKFGLDGEDTECNHSQDCISEESDPQCCNGDGLNTGSSVVASGCIEEKDTDFRLSDMGRRSTGQTVETDNGTRSGCENCVNNADAERHCLGGSCDERTHFTLSEIGQWPRGATLSSRSESISSPRRHSTGSSISCDTDPGHDIPLKSRTLPARSANSYSQDDDVDVIQSLVKLKDCGWYWGPLSYEDAEAKLANKPDGSFLVRDSSDERYIISVSFRALGKTQHTRIEHFKGLFSFHSQPATHEHATIVDFIEAAINHSKDNRFLYFIRPTALGSPPIPVQLAHPISRFKILTSLQHMCRFLILRLVRYDHIDKLPLPVRVKAYLQEQQYYTETLSDDGGEDDDNGDGANDDDG